MSCDLKKALSKVVCNSWFWFSLLCSRCYLTSINNFNPEKSKNPFAYFTQIIHYAFLRRIQKEKKQLEIKTKIIERSGYEEVFTVDGDMTGTSSDYNQIKDSVQTRMNYQ